MHPLGAGRSPTDELGKKRRMTQFILRPQKSRGLTSALHTVFVRIQNLYDLTNISLVCITVKANLLSGYCSLFMFCLGQCYFRVNMPCFLIYIHTY